MPEQTHLCFKKGNLKLSGLGWEGLSGEHGYMFMCDWAPLLHAWNCHNTVNQLYPNTK